MPLYKKIKNLSLNAWEKLNEQTWFQTLKSKWEGLDTPQKNYFIFSVLASVLLVGLISILGSVLKVHRLKKDFYKKKDLSHFIQTAHQELTELKTIVAEGPFEKKQDWSAYFKDLAKPTQISATQIQVYKKSINSSQKSGKNGQEINFEIKLEKVYLKQIVQYILELENGPRPVKLKNLALSQTINHFLNSTLWVSGLIPSSF